MKTTKGRIFKGYLLLTLIVSGAAAIAIAMVNPKIALLIGFMVAILVACFVAFVVLTDAIIVVHNIAKILGGVEVEKIVLSPFKKEWWNYRL